MKLNRIEIAGILASLTLVVMGLVFAVSGVASAQATPQLVFCELNNQGNPVALFDDQCRDQGGSVIPDVCPEPGLQMVGPCAGDGDGGNVPLNQCMDGIDNDGDGKTDYPTDPDCVNSGDNNEAGTVVTPAACADGIDNDADGLVDMADTGCANASDTDETNAPPAAACADGIDNDADGLIDMADAGCANAADTDEVDGGGNTGGSSGSSGGSGGSGGGSYLASCMNSMDDDNDGLTDMNDPGCENAFDGSEANAPLVATSTSSSASSTGEVLGTASSTPVTSCDTYLTSFIRSGGENDADQVMRLQKVLKTIEGAALEENGVYDEATLAAVHAFQTKYGSEILQPWGIADSTGFVYLTTRKKVNELYCKGKAFPLTAAEESMLTEVKQVALPRTEAGMAPPRAAAPKAAVKPATKPAEVEVTLDPVTSTTSEEQPVKSFLRRLFDRLR